MSIYDYETFEIKSLIDASNVKQKNQLNKINLLHRYNSIIWQGPLYVKSLSERFKGKNLNYIVEIGDDIGLTLLLISLRIEILAVDKRLIKKHFDKIFSIANKEKIKILYIEKLNIILDK